MKTIQTLIAVVCLLSTSSLWSQFQEYDIRFTLVRSDCPTRQMCYETQLRSADGQTWNLAGQNYRIYYDASMATYIDGTAKRVETLDPNQYSDILFSDHKINRDATGAGSDLSFESTLSFLNYSIDLMNLTNGGTDLLASGEWVSTTELCFEVTEDVINDPSECFGLVWARPERTAGIATAFVEVTEWVESNNTEAAEASLYDDLDHTDGDGSCISKICNVDGDPELSDPDCSDGVDNDLDGLIDCADPNCATALPCQPKRKTFDLALDLKDIDCTSGMVCYNVDLQSTADEGFLLGTQRYQLFYNSGVGSFVSGTSLLENDFQSLSLESSTPIENLNATGQGALPFESDLGFVKFNIQLADDEVGSTVSVSRDSAISVAELCFVMSDLAINEETVCFEATWARDGVTNAYNSSMVEIEEWLGQNSSSLLEADSSTFVDLTPTSGDDACFNISCVNTEEGDEECSDNIDNDDDGLIDCLDPGCGTAPVCVDGCNAVVPQLSSPETSDVSCDFTTGSITLNTLGGNLTDQYSTTYVLTAVDGTILQINEEEPEFQIPTEGFFIAYALNFKNGTEITGLNIGELFSQVGGTEPDACIDISPPLGFSACFDITVCNYCLGEEVVLEDTGNNPDPDFTNKHVLTDKAGVILSIVDEPIWSDLEVGIYLAFAVNYETSKTVVGLDTMMNLADIDPGCLNIGEPFVIGVCDQLNPTIFFDLRQCDITTTASIGVSETFDSYMWSTGSTDQFIDISATQPAAYRVTVALTNGCIGIGEQIITGNEVSRLGDFVFEDKDGNGRQNAEDLGINGVVVNLYADFDGNGIPDFGDFPSCTTVTSDHPQTGASGWYEFTLYQSNYVVEFVAPTGFDATEQDQGDEARDSDIKANGFTNTITIAPGTVVTNVDAGFRTSTGVGGIVWIDSDGDGRKDAEEEGIDGVTLNLYTANGVLEGTTLSLTDPETSIAGSYCFDDITVRDYYVELILPEGRSFTEANVGNDDTRDSDADGTNGFGTTASFGTSPGVKTQSVDFGIYTGTVVCGLIWREDVNGVANIYDEGVDSLIVNSQVELINASTNEVVSIGVTGDDGQYCINGIPVGSYRLGFRANSNGESYVEPNQGDDPLLDSDVDMNTGMTAAFFASPEDSIQGVNAGLRLEALPIELVSFAGYWDDADKLNVLDWTTASEINNDYIDIERVINNNGAFEVVGSVSGNGTTNSISTYTFSDDNINRSGTYYYRLKQVDYDGGFEYSNIIAIDVVLNDKVNYTVFPNPAKDRIQVDLMVIEPDYAEMTITDLMGRSVSSTLIHSVTSGHNTIELDCRDLVNGSYVVLIKIGNQLRHELIQIAK